jgi:hypothetical protein
MRFQDIGFAKKLLAGSALDTVLAWAPTGQTQKWTTYGIHSGEYPFVATMQPTLYVDGVSQGEMWDVVNNVALGELHEANDISCIGEGFGDFDSNGVEDTNDLLKMRVTYNFTPTGFGLITGIKWTGSADVNGIFGSTLPLTADMSGNIRFLPDRTNVVIGSAYTNKRGNGVYVYPTGIDCIIHATSSGPISSMYEQTATHKMYFDLNLLLLEGGIAPVSGTAWAISSFFQILKKGLEGDLNDDFRVDFYDFAKMASNWLIDCMTDPNDPACVLK